MSIQSNLTVGPAEETAYKSIGSIALAVGVQTFDVSISGKVNAHRGQLQFQGEAKNGLAYSSVSYGGNRYTTTGSGGVLSGRVLPEFDVQSNGVDPSEPFNGHVTVTMTVTSAGDFEMGVAAPGPMGEATAGDLGVIDLVVIA